MFVNLPAGDSCWCCCESDVMTTLKANSADLRTCVALKEGVGWAHPWEQDLALLLTHCLPSGQQIQECGLACTQPATVVPQCLQGRATTSQPQAFVIMPSSKSSKHSKWCRQLPDPLGPMTAAISPGLKKPDTPWRMASLLRLSAWFLTI